MASKHGSKPKRNKQYRGSRLTQHGGLGVIAARHGESAAELTLQHADHELRTQEIDVVNTQYYQALDDVKCGQGTRKAMGRLVTAMNVTCVLCERGYGNEYIDVVIKALEALHRGGLRGGATGVYRLDGDGIRAIQESLGVHDAQLAHATHLDIEAARRVIDERIAQGLTYTHQPDKARRR